MLKHLTLLLLLTLGAIGVVNAKAASGPSPLCAEWSRADGLDNRLASQGKIESGCDAASGCFVAAKETEVVYRWMSKAELKATQETGLLRGGRDGTHYVTDAANSDPLRARLRTSLEQTPEVRVKMEVPSGTFSVEPAFNMPGGGMERTAIGNVPTRVLEVQ